MSRTIKLLLAIILISSSTFAQNPEWSKEYPPYRVVGNVYYVGTYDLACYLIVTPQGSILINTGLEASDVMIKKNIETLGFKITDIKILLTTQAHFDHVAAMASIKKTSGARVMINEKDVPMMIDGGKSEYAFANVSFPEVKVDKVLHDKDTIKLGDTRIVMLDHPGHTKGSASYMMMVKDETKSRRLLIVNMPSIVIPKKFSEVTEYPTIAEDYARTFAALKDLQFDIWVSSHAQQFNMHAKRKPGDKYNPEIFADRQGYDNALKELKAAYDKKLQEK